MIKIEEEKQSGTRQLKLKQLESGLLLVRFDSLQKANQLTSAVMSEFETVLSKIEQDPAIKAVGIISAKPDTFLLGADLREIMQLKSNDAALRLVMRGQECFARFAALKKPTIAGIHGTCLGGGLELALCCHKRIATPSKHTILGLPETRLGFVPGLGGTQRLPRQIGLKSALDLILSAEPISVARALEIKLIDGIVELNNLEIEMDKLAQQLMLDGNLDSVDKYYEKNYSLSARDEMALKTARRSMRIITRGNYPALLRVIDVVEAGLTSGLKAGLSLEAETFAELAVGETSRNLVTLFFNAELVRQSALVAAEKESVPVIKTIGVIGGGMMGVGLAKYLTEKGFKILFRSLNKDRTAKAFLGIKEELQKNAARKNDSNWEGFTNQTYESDIQAVENDQAFFEADIILEATEENLATKIKLFEQLKPVIKDDCLLATITSSLSITSVASGLSSNTSIIGAHFFNPVDKMPLVEIALPSANYIAQNGTEVRYRQANAKLLQFLAELGKTPLSVKDSPCFLVNRLLACYLLEAGRLAEAGIPLSWIDKVAVDFGLPLGPLTLLDEIGFDLVFSVADTLAAQFPERVILPPVLKKVENLGMKGKRFGCGIYLWDVNGKRLGVNPRLINEIGLKESDTSPDESISAKISAALILPMVDEAAHCLDEKVVRRAREVDIGCVLGLGFPAFRGGILRYADSLGLDKVLGELNVIYAQTEPKRKVSHLLSELAQNNGKFYS